MQGTARLVVHWGLTLLHVDDLPYGGGLQDMPDVFTRFREQVEADFKVTPMQLAACRVCHSYRQEWQ